MLQSVTSAFRGSSAVLLRDTGMVTVLLFAMSSLIQVVYGDEVQCNPDQYIDPIIRRICKSCTDLCDPRRGTLGRCQSLCSDYYKLMFETEFTTEEPGSEPNMLGLYIGLAVGSAALVFIGLLAVYLIRRQVEKHRRKKEAEAAQREPLKRPIQVHDDPEPQVQ